MNSNRQAKKLRRKLPGPVWAPICSRCREPTVRDLSVPEANPLRRIRKTTLPGPPQEPENCQGTGTARRRPETAPAATTVEVLGRKSEPAESRCNPKPEAPGGGRRRGGKTAREKADSGGPYCRCSVPAAKPKAAPKKRKPLTGASNPIIGNYNCHRWISSSTRT